jgi:hypothetical protein
MNAPFRTILEVPGSPVRLSYQDPSMWIGSCFTENIGGWMREMKFPAMVNPFGTIFNPASINQNIELLLQGDEFESSDLGFKNGLYFSFSHHTSFSSPDKDVCLSSINRSFTEAAEFMGKTKFLFLTWGTAWIYLLKETGRVVANCHKLPDRIFERKLLSVEDIAISSAAVIGELKKRNPGLQVVLTVSPVRHLKDGFTGNQVSKSTLVLAAHELFRNLEGVHYFPAYEIVMDDLRDYRFYEEDMVHPNRQATGYIMEKFTEAWIEPTAYPVMKEVEKILKAVLHRPFNPNTPEHKKFLEKTLQQCLQLEKKYPFLDLQKEKEALSSI